MRHGRTMVLVVLVVLAARAGADTHHVDKDAGGANNGRTWTDAWTSFSAIDWGAINPGDRILISGGSESKIYYETLEVGNSGSRGLPITIMGAEESGHDGLVIIDGQNRRQNAVVIAGREHVVVRGLELTNATGGGTIRITYSAHVTVEGLSIYVRGHGGVAVLSSSYCIVRDNRIRTPSSFYSVQTDGIYAQENSNNTYEGNDIVITNRDVDQHLDGIQMFREDSATIRNNYVQTDHAQGIYSTEGRGRFQIYNNVVVSNTLGSVIGMRNLEAGTANYAVLNNTVIGQSANMIRVSGSGPAVKNNIVFKTVAGVAMRFEDVVNSFAEIDNNIVYASGDSWNVVYCDAHGGAKTWAQWRAMGAERSGMNVYPSVNPDGTPRDQSPAIGQGLDLSHIFTVDKNGVARVSGSWDIGAYQHAGTSPAGSLLAPAGLRIVQ